MKTFLINMRVNVPYPREFTAKVEAGQFHTAITRAIKYTLKPGLGKKRFEEVAITARRLKGIKSYGEVRQGEQ
jgi:hypothetical protein